jgi:DNA polymerase III delta prime subunit
MITEIAFKRDAGESFFYIFTQAHLLTTATSNRLLKKFEEPTPGYYFILFAESKESLLPTIISRSVITDYRTVADIQQHPILEVCTQPRISLSMLAKVIDKEVPNDIQTKIILESLIDRLHRLIIKPSIEYDVPNLQRRLSLCMEYMHNVPMPGGSKLFWRSLFLQLTQ